jgi:hypothetical protein
MEAQNWVCPMCHERGPAADDRARHLDYNSECCLSGYAWFRAEYPKGMKHHWPTGKPLSISEARMWQELGRAIRDCADCADDGES